MQKAADLGYMQGYNGLGYAYLEGKGVSVNASKAVKYYKLAAEQGSTESLANLAVVYIRGYPDIPQNVSLAIQFLKKSAALGSPSAMFNLAVMYYQNAENITCREALNYMSYVIQQGNYAQLQNIAFEAFIHKDF